MDSAEFRANLTTKAKLRIYGQLFAYEKLDRPIQKTVQNPVTGLLTTVTQEYREHDGKQFAVNYNSLYIKEHELDELLRQLCLAIKQDAFNKGLIIS